MKPGKRIPPKAGQENGIPLGGTVETNLLTGSQVHHIDARSAYPTAIVLRGGEHAVINVKLRAWVNAVDRGDELHAMDLYKEIRSMYEAGDRPDWKAAGLPGPSGFFGWASRDLRSAVVERPAPMKLADDEVLVSKGVVKKLPPCTFPGYKGEPSRLPGMKRG